MLPQRLGRFEISLSTVKADTSGGLVVLGPGGDKKGFFFGWLDKF